MNTPPPNELDRVAESLADSAELDWPALVQAHPELGDTLARLRTLEQLSAAHRDARLAAAAAVPETPTWGPLHVHEPLGEGAFGEVFRAFDPALHRDVALKLRRAGATGPARAWLDEARRLARVSHPNVLAVLGVAEHEGRAGLWTELVHGETLEARLAREGPLPAREVAHIGMELCRALAAVHAEGLVHGDVKTTNVMCERGAAARHPGRIVLMDFGAGQEGPPASPETWTPLVAAPEVLRGGETGPAADQYALGVLLYRLLTQRWPFEAENIADLAERSAQALPPLRELRPDLPPALHDAVVRALAYEPRERHANLSAFEHALAASLDPVPAPSAPARPRRRRLADALAVLVVVALGVLLLWRGRQVPAPARGPTPPAAATAPSTPRPLEVSATLLRRTASGSEPLVNGGVVRAGDRLALELRAAEPVWVYVLNEDATGAAYTLFPLAGLESTNPLAAGEDHRLPGRLHGRDFAWQVGEGGGHEMFVVVVSRSARADVAALATRLEQAQGAASTRPVRRGVEGVVEDVAPPATPGPVTRLAEQIASARDPDVWLWRVHAVHAKP